MSLERLKNVATELSGELNSPDLGYRLVKIDSTNMTNVTREPDATDQLALEDLERSVKHDRTSEDVLFQVLLDWGLEFTMPIQKENANGFDIYNVEEGALMLCVRSRENSSPLSSAASEIADRKPLRVVFLDEDFADDAERINVEQIFREKSPTTEVKAL